jgi:ABC-type polysaccharide/polyol phosphate export permease
LGRLERNALLSFDLREAYDDISFTVYHWIYFGFEFFIYGALISKLIVSLPNYLYYYGTGLLILVSFNVASWSGRRFVESAHEGRLRYMLSLPMKRSDLFLEQLELGVIVNLSRILPPLIVILWLGGLYSPIALISSIIILTLVTIGIMGMMVSLSVIAFKSFDIYSAIVAALSALLIRFSTVNYPLASMSQSYGTVSLLNPLTYGADLFRHGMSLDTSVLLDPVLAATIVIALCVGTIFVGMFFISTAVEGVRSS